MRRKRRELRLLVRRVRFRVAAEDFLWDLAGFDGGLLEALVLSGACANTGAREHRSALKHNTKRKDLENPATFL